MFSEGISKLFTLFVVYSMFVDLRFTKNMKEKRLYNNFELHAGSYADISRLVLAVFVILEVSKIKIPVTISRLVFNLVLALLYCGTFKLILQKIIRSTYHWVDTKREEKDLRKINRKRTGLFISYLILLLFFRHLTFNIQEGVLNNIISVLGVFWFSGRASKKCSRINNKIKKEETNDNQQKSKECNCEI